MERNLLLGGLLKRVGNFSMKSLEDRIIFQKTTYFLEAFDIHLNYNFSWYLYGPYSSDLATDGFKLEPMFSKVEPVFLIDNNEELKFQKFMEFLGNKKNDSHWLELLASIHFLRKIYPNLKKEEIFEKVKLHQPYLNDDSLCKRGWSYLELSGLVK